VIDVGGDILAVAAMPAQRSPALGDDAGPPPAALQPLRILVAEDNAVNQRVVLLMLERLGYSADVAADGLEVLAALRRQSYDLVLMDVQMPGMDGLEATRRIRGELPAELQPRIVAVTANALNEHREACLSAGMDDFLSKPILFSNLQAVLAGRGAATFMQLYLDQATSPAMGSAINDATIALFLGASTPEEVCQAITTAASAS